MLKIQVLGKGLIPRGYGLAPKKEPFPADLTLIGTIIGTPGLQVNYIHPETNRPVPLTRENYQRVYKTYSGVKKVVNEPKPVVSTESSINNNMQENNKKIESETNTKSAEDSSVKVAMSTPQEPVVSSSVKKDDDVIKPVFVNDKINSNKHDKHKNR